MASERVENPYRVYLRAELGKLYDTGAASEFSRHVNGNLLTRIGLHQDVMHLKNAFSSQAKVDRFVEGLADDDAQALTRTCDQDWRKNGVFCTLEKHRGWFTYLVPSELVDVQQAEPELGRRFADLGFKLTTIACDPVILQHAAYSRRGTEIAYPVLLGRWYADRCRLFDGVHRAVEMCRRGNKQLHVCAPVR